MSEVAKYSIKLVWKSFNVNITLVDKWCKANLGSSYMGSSGDRMLSLHFSEQPSDELATKVKNYWEGVHPSISSESHYVSKNDISARIQALTAGLLSKSWDQMSVAERKLVIGQIPTQEELGLV